MAAEPSLSARDERRLRELRHALETHDVSPTSSFVTLLPELRDLLGATAACAYGLRQGDGAAQAMSFGHFDGPAPDAQFHSTFSAFLGAAGDVPWGAYNPGRPEPAQRNRVVSLSWRTMTDNDAPLRIAVELFPKLGVGGKTQTRVVVCEGPSLLGWVGAWHDGECHARQTAILAKLTPALRRYLATERQLAQGARLGAFDAILDAVGKAAFVVDARGSIREANRLGREELRTGGRVVREELAAAVGASRAPSPPPAARARWETTRVRVGASFVFLALARTSTSVRLAAQVARAVQAWSLTPRQGVILERVAEGNANRTIAAMVGISERTVEAHVTALLDKAQVECRAELVAKVYTLE